MDQGGGITPWVCSLANLLYDILCHKFTPFATLRFSNKCLWFISLKLFVGGLVYVGYGVIIHVG